MGSVLTSLANLTNPAHPGWGVARLCGCLRHHVDPRADARHPADTYTAHLLLIEVKYAGGKNQKTHRAEAGNCFVSRLLRLLATDCERGTRRLPAAASEGRGRG